MEDEEQEAGGGAGVYIGSDPASGRSITYTTLTPRGLVSILPGNNIYPAYAYPMLTVKDDVEDHDAAIRSLNEEMARQAIPRVVIEDSLPTADEVRKYIDNMRFNRLQDHFNRRNLR